MYPENLKYNQEHLWVKVEGSTAIIGVTYFAQKQLGEILYVEMPETGDEVNSGESFGVVESSKTASDLISPVSGKVLEINEKLDDEPESVNESPYDSWIIKVELSNPGELDELMDAKEYEKTLA